MSERQPGWYFITWPGEDGYDVAWWDAEVSKWRQGDDIFEDGTAVVVSRIPTPDEPWQTVPVEATEGMIRRWHIPESEDGWPNSCNPYERYRSMLAAAPKPGGE